MTMVVPKVTIYFGLTSVPGDFFVLDDPVRGVLDGATYKLAGDVGVDVAADAVEIQIRRGRNRELDEFETGTASVVLENWDRKFDPWHTTGPYYGELTPGKRITIELQDVVVFDGFVEDWNLDWPTNGAPTATLFAVDALGLLAMKQFDQWTAHEGDTAGPRLHDILNRSEVNMFEQRDFDQGISVLQGDLVTWGSEALNYAQLVVKSDGGRLYVDRSGILVFRDRHNQFGATPVVEFRDDLTGVEFYGIETQTGSELLFNRVGVDREGGILQTVEDTASQDEYGVRSLSLTGLLLDSDTQSQDMAGYFLSIYGEPSTRVSSITLNVSALDPANRNVVSALDIGELVDVVWTPRGVGAQLSESVNVEGVEHVWSTGEVHMMVLRTSPFFAANAFTLDDAVLGKLDDALAVLAF